MSIPPPRTSSRRQTLTQAQVQQSGVARSNSSDRFVRDVLSSSASKEEPFAFASFLDNSSSDGPVLSFTAGIDASHDVEENEEKEEIEWAWSAPSSEPQQQPAVFAPDETERGADLLVDLNSAFSAAFGDKFEAPVPKRKGHSRGLSGVFVSPAPPPSTSSSLPSSSSLSVEAPKSADNAPPPSLLEVSTPSSRRRHSVSPRNLLANKAAAAEKNDATMLDHREKVVRELLDSEQVYVDSLNKLIELFYRPLTGREEKAPPTNGRGSAVKEAPLLNKSDADLLFGQVEVIMLYNQRLLLDLKDRLNGEDYSREETPISDIFIKMKSFLQVYVYYSENYPRAMKVYEAVMSRNSRTKRVLKAAEKEAGNVLEAFLILPIQRIPRYILLLKEIIRFSPPHHPDLKALTETVEAIKELCSAINEAPKKLQEANEMLSIYKRLVPSLPDLLVASRHLVCQTRAWVINADGADQVHDNPPKNVGGKQAFIVTLKAKQNLEIVLAFKEEEEKTQLISDISKFNPAIVFGTPSFVPLSERAMPEEKEKKEGSMKMQRPSSDTAKSQGSMLEESAGKFSGLLSRKKTLTSTPIGSRKSVKSPANEFEIVRTDVAASPPKSSGSTIQRNPPAAQSADVTLTKEISMKMEEQQNLQKLLQFYRKCNDEEGVAEATSSIARLDAELLELKQKVRSSSDKLVVAEETNKKRQHARKRSMSTSALPKMIAASSGAAVASAPKLTDYVVASPSAVRRPDPVKPVKSAPTDGSCALYDFTGANEGELTCKAGDALVAKSENGDWILCELTGSGKVGWLPKSYVRKGKEAEAPKVKTPFDED